MVTRVKQSKARDIIIMDFKLQWDISLERVYLTQHFTVLTKVHPKCALVSTLAAWKR